MMIQIEDKIISTEILTAKFCCDLSACKGRCCVEGNSGAPLEIDEVSILEEEYENYRQYMKPEGIKAIEEQGVMVIDQDGDLTTPLINGEECAYVTERDGITFCAIERAFLAGETTFHKPISCHLYPIRVARFSNGTYGLNYHKWDVCSGARVLGEENGISAYKMLKNPIERKFGAEFYKLLDEAALLFEAEK